jgi:hypothetical protein
MFVGQLQKMGECDFCHHSVSILLLRQEFYPIVWRPSKTFDLVFLVHGCTLSHLALKPQLESGSASGLG